MEGVGPKNATEARHARFRRQILKDGVLILGCVATLASFRVALLLANREELSPESSLPDVAMVLLNGLRYDGKIAGILAMPSVLASFACLFVDLSRAATRVRRIAATVFVLATVPLCVIEYFYFREYHAQFDHFILGAVYDDTGAVLGTVWKTYPVVPGIVAIALITLGGIHAFRWAIAREWAPAGRRGPVVRGPVMRVLSIAVALVVYAVVLRGSVTSRTVRERDAAITGDAFLDELVLNPYVALSYAVNAWRELESSDGLRVHLEDGDVRAAALRLAAADPQKPPRDIDEALIRTARGRADANPPRHIFLIVMESDDAWPLQERWADLHLADEMKALGREGILLDRFLPASSGTMSTFSALVSGLADAGVHTNYQPSAARPYPTSIAPIFESLGYRTRVFYGGYLSWQRVGDFCREQGFDEVYGAAHMGPWVPTNEWGVEDEELYDFLSNTVTDEAPSFNVVLTTSNHPPFDLDPWEKGWPVREIPAGMEEGFEESGLSLRVLGHHAYADAKMGRFVREASARFPTSVFAVTGDHHSRRFPGARPTLIERTAVPLLLYGPRALAGRSLPAGTTGAHHDIVPTLVDLAAPADFRYHAIGRSLFDPRRPAFAIGPLGRVLGQGWIADLRRGLPWEALPGFEGEPDLASARRAQADFLGVAWWRIRVGSDWDALPTTP